MTPDTFIKTSAESKPFVFDASDTIPSGSTILTTTVVVTDEDGTAVTSTLAPSGATFVGTTITVVIAAGTNGKNYLATITITTNAPSIDSDTLNIHVRDDLVEKYEAKDTTLAEYKLLMRIEDDKYDELLGVVIPAMKRFVVDYTGNSFKNKKVCLYSDQLAFVASSRTITDADSLFLTHYFTSDSDIIIEDSIKNDDIKHVLTAAAGTLTLATYETLLDEAAESPYVDPDHETDIDTGETNHVTITQVVFPRSLKMLMATLLWHVMKTMAYDPKYREGATSMFRDGRKGAQLLSSNDFTVDMLGMLDSFKKLRV